MNKKIPPVFIVFILVTLLTFLLWTPALGQDMPMATATPAPRLPTAEVTPLADNTGILYGTVIPYGYGMTGGMMGGGMMGSGSITSGVDADDYGNMSCPMMGSMGGSMGAMGSTSGMPMASGSLSGIPMTGSSQITSGQITNSSGFSFWNLSPWWVFGWVLLGVFIIAMISGIVVGSVWLIRKNKPAGPTTPTI